MMSMSDYEIGYGKPPKHTQFKAGNNANPKGRPKHEPQVVARVINDVSSSTTRYVEGGRSKKATWTELALRKMVKLALAGNLRSIEAVLKQLIHFQRLGDTGVRWIEISDWLPDSPGQTADDKNREFAETGNAKPIEWWNEDEQLTPATEAGASGDNSGKS
jgi:hypothetical protein